MLRSTKCCLIILGLLLFSACATTDTSTTLPPSYESSGTLPTPTPTPTPTLTPELTPTPEPPQGKFSYFIGTDGIYRRDLATLVEMRVTSNIFDMLLFLGEYVFFTENDGIYTMDEFGEARRVLEQGFNNIFTNGEFLFFNSSTGVYKYDLACGSVVKLYSGECRGMVLYEDYIFFTKFVPFDYEDYHECGPSPPNGELWRMDIDGENAIFLERSASFVSVYNGLVYFRDDTDYLFYSMTPTTLEKNLVFDHMFIESPVFHEMSVFFIYNRHLYEHSFENGETHLVNGLGFNMRPRILDGYIYFFLYSGDINGLCRMNLVDRELEVLYTT